MKLIKWIKSLMGRQPSTGWVRVSHPSFVALVRKMSFKDRCRLYSMRPGDTLTVDVDGKPHTFTAGDEVRLK